MDPDLRKPKRQMGMPFNLGTHINTSGKEEFSFITDKTWVNTTSNSRNKGLSQRWITLFPMGLMQA